ncbi:MAG TPA: peptidyl-prolyl cis-trans isomerase [Thermoanaerobaculia bacterium]|nr:peptidyl-prolyl cis-trans isomerase [Thermoanaerobaculia bacterium]
MLKVMRDSFHHLKWVLIAVVAAFIFGFVFIDMGLGGGLGGNEGGDPRAFAARVNGEVISFNEYSRFVKNLEDMYRQMYGQQFTPEMSTAMGLPKQALDSLVDQKLLEQEARRLHLAATPEEVRKKLLSIPTFNKDGKFVGVELYTRYVTGPLGYASAADFEEDIAREITVQKIESAMMSSLIVSPKAAEAEYRRVNENARIRYVLMPSTLQMAGLTVTPAEVEAYYKAHQAEYAHGEQRQIRYLMADHSRLRGTITPTDEELRQAYAGNRDRYRQQGAAKVLHILVKVDPTAAPAVDAAAKAKAEALVAQLRGGVDFAALARANSDDPSSSGSGGEMGWVEMGQTVQPFEQAIFSIPLNTISDPIRSSDFGYHIVKVTERRAETVRPFEEVRGELVNAVAGDKAKAAATNEINRIYTILRQNKPKDVKAFINLANDKVTSNDSGWFAKGDPVGGIGPHPRVTEWAFTAQPGDVSEPMGTPRGPVVAYIAGVRPGGVSALADVRPRVEEAARQEKARAAAKNALAQQMAGAASIDQLSAKTGQPAQDATVSRQGQIAGLAGDTSALVEAAIKAGIGTLQGPIAIGNGAVAFQVLEQKKITDTELAANRTSYIDTLRGQQARSLRAVLIQRLRKGADIEVNDEITRPTTTPAGV